MIHRYTWIKVKFEDEEVTHILQIYGARICQGCLRMAVFDNESC